MPHLVLTGPSTDLKRSKLFVASQIIIVISSGHRTSPRASGFAANRTIVGLYLAAASSFHSEAAREITSSAMDAVTKYLQPYAPTALGVAIIVCLVFFAYRSALPKPIPGIPYDERAAKNLFGNLPETISYIKQNGVVMPWLTGQNAKHHAPLVQFFGLPFSKPTLILSDFQESQDILLRRTKDFDRASRSIESFQGSMPNHHLSMKSADPRFKGNKELVRDLMSPGFLADVRPSLSSPSIVAMIENF